MNKEILDTLNELTKKPITDLALSYMEVVADNLEKDKEKCTVKLINPKDLSKASESEKNACAMVINQIEKALQEIQD